LRPELILHEAGGAVTDYLGAPLRYNPVQPHGSLTRTPAVVGTVVARVVGLYRG
jgi:3'-phosphoadenosine 5'-phosphosulfate (PAPS) 3'-phosphatase